MLHCNNIMEDQYSLNLVAGSVLKKRRILLGLSQNALAKIVGVESSDIKRYENTTLPESRLFFKTSILYSIANFFVM